MKSARPVIRASPARRGSQTIRFDPEIREWAVRIAALEMKEKDPGEAIACVIAKVGCTAATLRRWIRQAERAGGIRPGVFTNPGKRVSELEEQVAALKAHNARLALEKHRGSWGTLIIGAPATAERTATASGAIAPAGVMVSPAAPSSAAPSPARQLPHGPDVHEAASAAA
jgi:transposase